MYCSICEGVLCVGLLFSSPGIQVSWTLLSVWSVSSRSVGGSGISGKTTTTKKTQNKLKMDVFLKHTFCLNSNSNSVKTAAVWSVFCFHSRKTMTEKNEHKTKDLLMYFQRQTGEWGKKNKKKKNRQSTWPQKPHCFNRQHSWVKMVKATGATLCLP